MFCQFRPVVGEMCGQVAIEDYPVSHGSSCPRTDVSIDWSLIQELLRIKKLSIK